MPVEGVGRPHPRRAGRLAIRASDDVVDHPSDYTEVCLR